MSFDQDLGRFTLKLRARKALFVNVAGATKRSITDGSQVTAAPGQPVDTGALKASWILGFPSPTLAEITTNIVYAPVIEDNVRGARLRSKVGGFHSVKLTVAGFQRLVDDETRKLSDQ